MAQKTRYIEIIGSFLIAIVGIVFFAMPILQRNAKGNDINIVEKFEKENFIRALDEKEKFSQCDGEMIGAIVPHHMVGAQFTADVFSQVKDVDTVVIIGPNHWEKGGSPIITSRSDWITAKGRASMDRNFIDGLVSRKIATAENDVIGDDHSIGNIIPFVAYYLPNAHIVPIIVKRSIPQDTFDAMIQYVIDQGKKTNILIIGSVDFSHYLTAQQSEKKDEITIQAILDRDYSKIRSFDDDHIDSPSSVIALLKITDALGSNALLWRNSNSFKVLGSDINNTTSYFELIFCRNK